MKCGACGILIWERHHIKSGKWFSPRLPGASPGQKVGWMDIHDECDQSWAYNRVWAVETTPWGTRGTCPPPPLLTNGRTRGHREWKKQLTRNWPNCTNHHESATSTVGLIANFGNVFIKRLTNFLHVSTFLIFLFERSCLCSIIGGDTISTAATIAAPYPMLGQHHM